MCTTTSGTRSLDWMLSDPLIQAVRRSDGVSEHEYEALLFRVKDTLAERGWSSDASRQQMADA